MATCTGNVASAFRTFEGLRGAQRSTESNLQTQKFSPKVNTLRVTSEKKAPKRAEIILVEDIPSLGKAGELLSVKKGYFRNFLYPSAKAKPATPKILKQLKFEQDKKEAALRQERENAEAVARKFQTIGQFIVRRKIAKGKTIFGSVSVQDIVDIIKAQTGRELEKKDIDLPDVQEIGFYDVSIKLHPEVTAVVKINVTGK